MGSISVSVFFFNSLVHKYGDMYYYWLIMFKDTLIRAGIGLCILLSRQRPK